MVSQLFRNQLQLQLQIFYIGVHITIMLFTLLIPIYMGSIIGAVNQHRNNNRTRMRDDRWAMSDKLPSMDLGELL